MNVNPLKVNIELKSDDINSKWYAKKDVSKDKETTVTFFQREGKRTFLQKIKDFRHGVRYGTELASKYSKELGLSREVFSNPKNKSEKPTISNDTLNTKFREAQEKLQKNESFKESDSLVSHNKISININAEKIYDAEDYKNLTLSYFMTALNHTKCSYADFKEQISLALDLRANPGFPADNAKIDNAIESLNNLKNNTLTGNANQELTKYVSRKSEFDTKINSLITVLEKASKKDVDKEKNYEVRKDVKMHVFKLDVHRDDRNNPDFTSHLGLAMDVRDKPNFSANKDEMEAAKKALTDFKKIDGYNVLNEIKTRVDKSVAELIKALDAAIAKASPQNPTI